MKEQTLILNKYYFPINVDEYKRVFTNIASGSHLPLDIHYEINEDGSINFENINFWNIIKSIDLWMDLPIRPYDNFIHTVNGDKILNSKKSNKLLSETKLKLRYKPFKPTDGYKFEIYREEWHSFLANF